MELVSIVVDAIRIAVGLVLLVSAGSKLRDVRGFAQGVKEYRILPARLSTAFAFLLIPIEGFVGLSFVGDWLLEYSVPLGLLLLVSFLIAVGMNVQRHRDLACYCFGAASAERVSKRTLARILLLLLGTAIVLVGEHVAILHDQAPASSLLSTEHSLAVGVLQVTTALFVLVAGRWVLATPDLLRLWSWRLHS